MELYTTVVVKIYDTAGKIPEGTMKSTLLFRGLLLFLLDVLILFWWLKQTKKRNGVGFVISCNYSLLRGVGKTPCTPVVSRHSPFIRSPTCFCCSFIGLISCHSEVFSKWLEREQLASPGWCCSGFLLWNFSEGLLLGSAICPLGRQWLVRPDSWIRVRQNTVNCHPNRTIWDEKFPDR